MEPMLLKAQEGEVLPLCKENREVYPILSSWSKMKKTRKESIPFSQAKWEQALRKDDFISNTSVQHILLCQPC